MGEIILKSKAGRRKPKRSSVVVSPETYIAVYNLAHEIDWTIEELVDTLLKEALPQVKIIPKKEED